MPPSRRGRERGDGRVASSKRTPRSEPRGDGDADAGPDERDRLWYRTGRRCQQTVAESYWHGASPRPTVSPLTQASRSDATLLRARLPRRQSGRIPIRASRGCRGRVEGDVASLPPSARLMARGGVHPSTGSSSRACSPACVPMPSCTPGHTFVRSSKLRAATWWLMLTRSNRLVPDSTTGSIPSWCTTASMIHACFLSSEVRFTSNVTGRG